MDRHYYLHRITNEWKFSYPLLLEEGLLSMGWSGLDGNGLMEACKSNDLTEFNKIMEQNEIVSKSRWGLWRFGQFSVGDYIVVPMFGSKFCVFEVTKTPISIGDLDGQSFRLDQGKTYVQIKENEMFDDTGRKIDIGFVVPVKRVTSEPKPRNYATARLVARMKIRNTNALIDDISSDVDASIISTGPIDMHEEIISAIQKPVMDVINHYITPENFEKIVKWYFEKQGADQVWIPAKNASNKDAGADADVIAVFSDLNITFYVQVKKHDNMTGEWAVTQISNYMASICDEKDAAFEDKDNLKTTNIAWVISKADDYDEKAKQSARKKNVRLINGEQFIKMIMNVGIDGIESITDSK